MNILKEKTRSLCPTCLQEIPAQVYEEDGRIYMSKNCPQHGDFNFLIEKDAYIYKKLMNKDKLEQRRPFNNVMIAVTHSCDLNCPICYLPNRDRPDLSLDDIKKAISSFDGRLIRLSGGEPTLREDLPQIIRFVCQQGKRPVILTNGLKLADRDYVKELKKAGLRRVHFSFNGFDDEVYKKIDGRGLLKIKLKALNNLKRENMDVTISVMLVKGINEKELKKIYRFCLRNSHFIRQLRIRTLIPVGRYPDDQEQICLSDIITMISKIIGVHKKDLVEHYLSLFRQDYLPFSLFRLGHRPCGLDIHLLGLLLGGSNIKKIRNPLFRRINIIFKLLLKIGLRNTFAILIGVLIRKLRGEKVPLNFRILIRVWPDKYSIDLDEIERCPSSHLVGETGEIIPFCYGLTMNEKKVLL